MNRINLPNNNNFHQEANSGDDKNSFLHQILFKYLPYWPLFLLLAALSAGAAWVYLKYTIPTYETTATVLIKDEKKGIDDSKLLEELNLFGAKKIVENEIEIMRSKTILREVIKNLRLYAPISQEGKIIDYPAYFASPVKIELKNPDSLIEQDKIYLDYNPGKKIVIIEKKSYPVNEWLNSPWGQIRFLPNNHYRPSQADAKRRLYFVLVKVKEAEKDLSGSLTVSAPSKTATIINLNLKDQIPERGEEIINELLKVYNKASIEDKNRFAANTMSFIEDRLRYVIKELEAVESSIQTYKTAEGIVDISEQSKVFMASVGANDQKIAEMNLQIAVLDQVENYVKNKVEKSGIVPSTLGLNDPILNQLLEKLYDGEMEYERLKKTTAENNPILISLRNEIDKVRPSVMENIQNQRRSLEAAKNDLSITSGRYLSALRTVPTKERQLVEISREQSIKNNIYTYLLQRREETALSYYSTVADSRIVDDGQSSIQPISPKKRIIYLAAILAAVALGIGILSIKEALNRNILYRQEIEQLTPFPIIGEIAHNKSKEAIVLTGKRRDFIAEQFRQLRTSLSYLGLNQEKKRILVTSSIPGEGKSFISSNLALSLALAGKKVVIISLDLRKPRIHEIFNLNNEVGITNFFIGEKEPDEIIFPYEKNENLFIIPSGPIPPNPSELIMNGKLQKLLSYLGASFDYIIMDAPPVNPVTDGYILAQSCDTVLYVVRHGVTPKADVKLLKENAKIRGVKNLAIIFNGVKSRGMGEYGYGGYGYDHDYGYSQENDKSKKRVKFLRKA
jgi:tyrosine-protein kinase Etk/Wzc